MLRLDKKKERNKNPINDRSQTCCCTARRKKKKKKKKQGKSQAWAANQNKWK
jgi:hypothetical protein